MNLTDYYFCFLQPKKDCSKKEGSAKNKETITYPVTAEIYVVLFTFQNYDCTYIPDLFLSAFNVLLAYSWINSDIVFSSINFLHFKYIAFTSYLSSCLHLPMLHI